MKPVTRICWYCSQPFVTTATNKRYCDSPACVAFCKDHSNEAMAERARIRKEKMKDTVPTMTRLCDYCGKRFELPPSDNRKVTRFCSRACRDKARGDQYDRNTRELHKSLVTRVCHDCGKPTSDYRCAECREKWKIENHVTSNSDVTIYCRVGRYDS